MLVGLRGLPSEHAALCRGIYFGLHESSPWLQATVLTQVKSHPAYHLRAADTPIVRGWLK